jgi:hypothetical protein
MIPRRTRGRSVRVAARSRTPRMTIGTKDASVLAVEAGALVRSFKKGEKGVESVPPEGVYVKGRINKGLFSSIIITPVILSCYH